jgi:hypothetical protein
VFGNPSWSGLLKIPNGRRQSGAAAGNFGARQPPANAFAKKKEKGVRNHVPHAFLREGPPRSQPLKGKGPPEPTLGHPV